MQGWTEFLLIGRIRWGKQHPFAVATVSASISNFLFSGESKGIYVVWTLHWSVWFCMYVWIHACMRPRFNCIWLLRPSAMPSSKGSSWSRIPGIELGSLASPALAGGFFTTNTTWEALWVCSLPLFLSTLKSGSPSFPTILCATQLPFNNSFSS